MADRANQYAIFSSSYNTSFAWTSKPVQLQTGQTSIETKTENGKKYFKKQKKKEDKRLKYLDNSDYEYNDGYEDNEDDAKHYLR